MRSKGVPQVCPLPYQGTGDAACSILALKPWFLATLGTEAVAQLAHISPLLHATTNLQGQRSMAWRAHAGRSLGNLPWRGFCQQAGPGWCGWCTSSCILGGTCPPQGTPAGCRGTSSSLQVSSGTHTGLGESGVHEKRRFGEGWDAPVSPPRLLTGGGRRSPLLLRTGTSQLIPTAPAGDEALDGARRWARRRAPSCSALCHPPSWPGCHAKEAVTEILMLPRRSNWHQLNCYIHV